MSCEGLTGCLSSHTTQAEPWMSQNDFPFPQYVNIFSITVQFRSVQFSRSVVSDSLRPQELQHARPACPSPNPGVHPNPCPSSRWCHPTISSSVVPFSSCPQSFPASGSFQINQLCASGGQSIGVSTSSYPGRDICILMFIPALFIIFKSLMQPEYPLTKEQVNQIWYILITKY